MCRQRDDAADTERGAVLPALALFNVPGSDANAPVGGEADVRQLGERREQPHDALGAIALVGSHAFVLVLVAEAHFFVLEIMMTAANTNERPVCLSVGRTAR